MHSRGWGGSEELWSQCALYARSQGCKVGVISFFEDFVHDKLESLQDSGIELFFVKPEEHISFFGRIPKKVTRLLYGLPNVPHSLFLLHRWVNEFSPDTVVISQGSTYNFIHFPAIRYLLKNIALPSFLISQHHYECGALQLSFREIVLEYLSFITAFFFVSERNLQVAKRQLASSALPPMETVKNPCKLSLEQALPFPQSVRINLAAVTRLDCNNKALDLLFEALTDPYFQTQDWHLELWGTGPDEAYLKQLAQYYKLDERIHFCGLTEQIQEVWERNKILILPSYNEGTPLSIMEAMMCGRPCFVTDVGDNEKLIEDGVTGYLVPAPTLKLIRKHLIRCFEDSSTWETLGQQAHLKVKSYIEPNAGKALFDRIVSKVK